MTERSRFWDGTATGDASEAPYDASTEFSQVLTSLGFAEPMSDKGGIYLDDTNDFSISSPGANTQRVATGRALVYGSWYYSDANVDVSIPTPAASTRIDRIVLRKSWSAQTVRITRIAGTEGAGAPSLTQSAGTTWDVPLYQVSITTGGVMTVTDQRVVVNGLYGASGRAAATGTAFGIGGNTPKAWDSTFAAWQAGTPGAVWGGTGVSSTATFLSTNTYYSSAGHKAIVTGGASRIYLDANSIKFGIAPSVSADAAQTFTDCFTIGSTGAIGVGNQGASSSSALWMYQGGTSGTSVTSGVNQFGIYCGPTFSSGATTAAYGMQVQPYLAAAAFTMSQHFGIMVETPIKGAGSAITTNYGIYIAVQSSGATNYGIWDATTNGSVWAGGLRVGSPNDTNRLHNSSTGAGTATLYIGNASINVTSDRRLKRAITPTNTDWLDVLNRVKIKDFTWNDPSDRANPWGKHSRGRWTGVVAQELIQDAPELRFTVNAPDINCPDCRGGRVCIVHDSYWNLDLQFIVGPMIGAIQRLTARVAALEGA